MDGVLLCDKPAGPTSHDIVAAARRAVREATGERRPRVGHAGTLDPFATGLLLVLVGRATRVQRFLMDLPKTYEVVARFGAVSTTGDPDGEITETGVVPEGDLELPVGPLLQRPPMYSAVQVDGRRAYDRARAGETFELAERPVTVHAFEELWRDGARRAFRIECSSGTYVRSLIADLGDAHCTELRRTAIGPFSVADAGAPDALAGLRPIEAALSFLPRRDLAGDDARAAAHGRAVPGEAPGPALLVDADGAIAIAEPHEDGTLKPIVGFRGSEPREP
ncbi:MAG: tRNA pseudouridine synthase [Solirubrobacteraceae bacterium]|nr:tRNA pseudouridine synthase [Solirubrobacteraceae bacterium]